jgi:dTDP-4-dehydrorhamnose 3,5-epimerase
VKIRPLTIAGSFEILPVQHGDHRGQFLEWYRFDHLQAELGHPLDLAQANLATSVAGVVRGIHYADVPPGQAKYVTCVRGAVLDVVVDLRVGSPTFGQWEAVRLDDADRRAVYLGEGLAHAYCALTDATLVYLCSQTYAPGREHVVHPLDPELGIDWPSGPPILSERDASAPSLARAREEGRLPDYRTCLAYASSLRAPQ